jgi:histidine phosphotransferase ChpT
MAHQHPRLELLVHRMVPCCGGQPVSAPDLSALVSARLCHDLISPMGAIGNGLELLQLAGGSAAQPELALVNESLANALAKLRFFRIAFGPADAQARQTAEEAAQLTDAMFSGRFTVHWQADGGDMARPLARIVYLAVLCLEKSLPMGGNLRVAIAPDAVALAVDGRRTAPPAELWEHVVRGTPVPGLKADGVQFALLRQALEATGHEIAVAFDETSATVRIAQTQTAVADPEPC